MNRYLFFLLPFLAFQSSAQDDYFPMDSVSTWNYTVGSLIGSSSLTLEEYGDTIINGLQYRRIGYYINPGFLFEYYMREDRQERKVYAFNNFMDEEELYYDFSLEVGDFFVSPRFPEPVEVIEKSTVMTACGELDHWRLSIQNYVFEYTEALGADFLFYQPFISDPVYFLDCAYSGSKKIVGDSTCMVSNCQGEILLNGGGAGSFANTDAPITEEYSFDLDGCEMVCISVEVSTNGQEWIGSGNLETSQECLLGQPDECVPDPFNSTAGSCEMCWDFLYARFFIGDSMVYENLLGDDPNDALEATWEVQVNTADYPGVSEGSVIIMGQTFAANENLSYQNLRVTCLDDAGSIIDNDGDGFDASIDCNDNNPSINPDAVEICDDVDNDCNGMIDEGLLVNYYADNDGDGFGDSLIVIQSCSDVMGFTLNNTDCDDSNADINPDADEICDGVDNNCDGEIDEGFVLETYYSDGDMDGYGSGAGFTDCFQPPDTSTEGGDCDDTDPNINPGAIEIPNNDIDEDCDGEANVIDLDGDGWNSDEDCDDTNADINPDATEINGNGIDEDCDGVDGASSVYETETFSIEIFPNPVLNELYLKTNEVGLNFEIYSMDGIKVICESVEERVDLSDIPEGIYLIKVYGSDSDGFIIHKMMKL